MNSCLYACDVMHARTAPKKNRFTYKVFMFYFDLDEIDGWVRRLWSVSRNRANLFSFRDRDHLERGFQTTKENILDFIASKGITLKNPRVMLLTHLRMFGHLFNPVSFYFCFDGQNRPVCSVVEVCNTYREMKPYLLGGSTWREDSFRHRVVKNFYVSPFIDLDAEFDFRLKVPGDRLQILIDDYKRGEKLITTALIGKRVPLTNGQLFLYMLRFPVITLQVLTLIHWQALVLWIKRVPHHRKADHPELQLEVYNAKRS